jgi:hypothetical protein
VAAAVPEAVGLLETDCDIDAVAVLDGVSADVPVPDGVSVGVSVPAGVAEADAPTVTEAVAVPVCVRVTDALRVDVADRETVPDGVLVTVAVRERVWVRETVQEADFDAPLAVAEPVRDAETLLAEAVLVREAVGLLAEADVDGLVALALTAVPLAEAERVKLAGVAVGVMVATRQDDSVMLPAVTAWRLSVPPGLPRNPPQRTTADAFTQEDPPPPPPRWVSVLLAAAPPPPPNQPPPPPPPDDLWLLL